MNRVDGLVVAIATLLSLPLLGSCTPLASPVAPPRDSSGLAAEPSPPRSLDYSLHDLPTAQVHVVRIPAHGAFVITPAVADTVQRVDEFAAQSGAIAVLNAGFFDPANQQTTSHVVIQGQSVADPATNSRLMENPDLTAYLPRILNRSEFRRYQCGAGVDYAIALHDVPPPPHCQRIDAIGAGPQLLPVLTSEAEGFVDPGTGRDALGGDRPNARTAIGITATGDVLWVMVAQRPGDPSSGLSLPDLAAFLRDQGAETALNLDGGSSSSLYYQGQTYYGRLDAQGDRVMRPVKSVLLVQPHPLH